jgi:hypothetical protein
MLQVGMLGWLSLMYVVGLVAHSTNNDMVG